MESGKPKVVITSSASMEIGFGRKVVQDFLEMANNMIIFTEQATQLKNSFAWKLLNGNKSILDAQFTRIKSDADLNPV